MSLWQLRSGLSVNALYFNIALYRVIQKEVYTFENLFYKYYWTYGDVLYIDWRENSHSYFHTLQALDVSPTCDAADVIDNPALPTLVAACHR
jgi:hypothetical protein